MQIAVEDLQPFHQLLQIHISILCMEEQLFGIAELEVVGGIEGQKHSGFEVAGLVLEMLHVGCEHVGQVFHYHRNILKSLVLGFGVHD